MPNDDYAFLIDDNRLPETELANGGGYDVDGRVVDPGVVVIRPNVRGVAPFDPHNCSFLDSEKKTGDANKKPRRSLATGISGVPKSRLVVTTGPNYCRWLFVPTGDVSTIAALDLGFSLDDGRSFQLGPDGHPAVSCHFDVRAKVSKNHPGTVGDGAQPLAAVFTA
jgi:hypothetical protein